MQQRFYGNKAIQLNYVIKILLVVSITLLLLASVVAAQVAEAHLLEKLVQFPMIHFFVMPLVIANGLIVQVLVIMLVLLVDG